MYQLDVNMVKQILIEEENYPIHKVELLLKDYPPIHPQLEDALKQWLQDRTVSDVVVDGLSISQVMSNRQTHFIVAIRDLSQLLDENIPVEKRSKSREILGTPIYFE